jgi:hypothetical protein
MEMSDLREEIEQQFKTYGLMEEKDDAENPKAKTPVEVTVCIGVPSGYSKKFAESFKNLPEDWQRFLSDREQRLASQLSNLDGKLAEYNWLDEIYGKNEQRLKKAGLQKVRDWLEGLAALDTAMAERPAETLRAMAKVYNVEEKLFKIPNQNVPDSTVERVNRLEKNYHDLISYMEKQQKQNRMDAIKMFCRQTDENGQPLHRYFNEVADYVFALLNGGAVNDVSEAYNQALWLNPRIREELITRKINSKAAEAQKAQDAAFAPKGKAKAPERELTLREEIEKNMAAFMD